MACGGPIGTSRRHTYATTMEIIAKIFSAKTAEIAQVPRQIEALLISVQMVSATSRDVKDKRRLRRGKYEDLVFRLRGHRSTGDMIGFLSGGFADRSASVSP